MQLHAGFCGNALMGGENNFPWGGGRMFLFLFLDIPARRRCRFSRCRLEKRGEKDFSLSASH
jgi:hypothetical protein